MDMPDVRQIMKSQNLKVIVRSLMWQRILDNDEVKQWLNHGGDVGELRKYFDCEWEIFR